MTTAALPPPWVSVPLAGLACWLLLLLLLPLLLRGLLDQPNARSAHSAPTPRGWRGVRAGGRGGEPCWYGCAAADSAALPAPGAGRPAG